MKTLSSRSFKVLFHIMFIEILWSSRMKNQYCNGQLVKNSELMKCDFINESVGIPFTETCIFVVSSNALNRN